MENEAMCKAIHKGLGMLALLSTLGIVGGCSGVAQARDEVKKDDPCCPQPIETPDKRTKS